MREERWTTPAAEEAGVAPAEEESCATAGFGEGFASRIFGGGGSAEADEDELAAEEEEEDGGAPLAAIAACYSLSFSLSRL